MVKKFTRHFQSHIKYKRQTAVQQKPYSGNQYR